MTSTLSRFEERFRMREAQLASQEAELNASLDAQLQANENAHPKAIYYIIPNEFAERFCFYGIKPLLLNFYKNFAGLVETQAKAQVHLFVMLSYFFPLLGAMLSDSLLAKYETIVVLSVVYFIGTVVLSVFSINGLFGGFLNGPDYAPWWLILIPTILIAIGTGGIKPCVSSHGGDQYLGNQVLLLTKFFSYFYIAINVGSLASGYFVPYLLSFGCFGAEKCYPLAFMIPSILFFFALIVFIVGKKTYRIVPAARTFLPWVAIQACFTATIKYFNASPEERVRRKGVLNFAVEEYGFNFIEEVRLLGKVIFMIAPYMMFWMIYDQGSTEWQEQYEKMNQQWGSLRLSPEQSTNINAFFIIVCLPIIAKFVYPALEKRGISIRPLPRMQVGFFLVILAFAGGALLQWKVDEAFAAADAAGQVVRKGKEIEECFGCVHGAWQLPQWLILTIGEVLVSPTGLEFVYTEVGTRFRATSSSFWLLFVSFGNLIVVAVETALTGSSMSRVTVDLMYCGIGLLGLIISIVQSRYAFTYKCDRTETYHLPPTQAVEPLSEKTTLHDPAPPYSKPEYLEKTAEDAKDIDN